MIWWIDQEGRMVWGTDVFDAIRNFKTFGVRPVGLEVF